MTALLDGETGTAFRISERYNLACQAAQDDLPRVPPRLAACLEVSPPGRGA